MLHEPGFFGTVGFSIRVAHNRHVELLLFAQRDGVAYSRSSGYWLVRLALIVQNVVV